MIPAVPRIDLGQHHEPIDAEIHGTDKQLAGSAHAERIRYIDPQWGSRRSSSRIDIHRPGLERPGSAGAAGEVQCAMRDAVPRHTNEPGRHR